MSPLESARSTDKFWGIVRVKDLHNCFVKDKMFEGVDGRFRIFPCRGVNVREPRIHIFQYKTDTFVLVTSFLTFGGDKEVPSNMITKSFSLNLTGAAPCP